LSAPDPPAIALLKQAVLLLQQGDAKGALAAASESRRAAPTLAQAHYVQGQAWSALGEHGKGEQAFKAAVDLAPQWADAWINYGIARYRQGAVDDAVTAMREALRRAPGHAAASANLGAFLRLTGDTEAAEFLLREGIAREPHNAGARLNLAAELLHDKRAGDALDLLQAHEPPADDVVAARHWFLQQSLALLQLGRPIDARAILDKVPALGPVPAEIAPLWHWRQLLLARLEGKATAAGAHAARMEAALEAMGPRAVPEHRIMAHFDLGGFWSEEGDPSRAFEHWRAGHGLLRPSQQFSRERHLALVEATMTLLDRTRFGPDAKVRRQAGDPVPVFIVGLPGSGKTSCEAVLAAHAQIHSMGEKSLLRRVLPELAGGICDVERIQRLAGLEPAARDAAAAKYLAELGSQAAGKSHVVDRIPGNFLDLGLVGLLLPGARIIHCVDDPREVGLAIFSVRGCAGQAWAHDLGDLGWYIGQHDRLMAHWRAVLPNPILTVARPDGSRDFDGTLARVLAHLDLPADAGCAGQRRTERSGRWRPHAQELAPLIEGLQSSGDYRFDEVDAAQAAASAPDIAGDGERPFLAIFQPDNKALSMGFAVEYLRRQKPFSELPFGSMSGTLVGQINRGHCLFVVDEEREVRGFIGWCLTTEEIGEAWIAGTDTPADEDYTEGDCVIINAWAADSKRIVRFMLNEGRKRLEGKRLIFFKRFYADGRRRPMRLAVTDFIDSHVRRSRSRAKSP